MAYFGTSEEFEDDLSKLRENFAASAELIDALIEELADDEEFVDRLLDEVPKWHFLHDPSFEFKLFNGAFREGRRIYTLKPYDRDGSLLAHRVFVGYDCSTHEFFALTISHRSECYDTNSASYRRLCTSYDGLRIPTITG